MTTAPGVLPERRVRATTEPTNAELRLPQSHPNPLRRRSNRGDRPGDPERRPGADHLRRRQRREDRHPGRGQGGAGRDRLSGIRRHRAEPDLRDPDAGGRARAPREGRLPARRRRRLGDRRDQVHRRGHPLRGRALGHPRQAGADHLRGALRQRADAAGDRLGDERGLGRHAACHARQARLHPPAGLPALLGAGPDQDLSRCRRVRSPTASSMPSCTSPSSI